MLFPLRIVRRVLAAFALLIVPLLVGRAATAGGSRGPAQEPEAPQGVAVEGSATPKELQHDPREWLPTNESLTYEVEVTFGPVRGLNVGKVTLGSILLPDEQERTVAAGAGADAGADADEERGRRLVGRIDATAKGGYLGYEVVHLITVNWYVGTHPRIEVKENLRGSRSTSREMRIGEIEGKWQLEYRRDRHCKGCDDKAHFVEGFLPWSDPHHCDDCQRVDHRVWRPYKYMELPEDTLDLVSALFYARGFLLSDQEEISLPLLNHDSLWAVRLRRGGTRRIKTEAGTFECMRVLIGPQLTAGEELGEEASARFEALFGLHGDIGVWVDREGGFPVVIEGTAPLGPFDVAVKASLISRREG